MSLPSWLQHREIVDAKTGCTLNILPKDIEGAKAQDGANCVAAKCSKRAFGASHAHFFRTTAYIDFGAGKPVERFVPSRALLNDVIKPLDAGKLDKVKEGRYSLLPPAKSYRLGQASKNRAIRKAKRAAGLLPPPVKQPYRSRRVVGRMQRAA